MSLPSPLTWSLWIVVTWLKHVSLWYVRGRSVVLVFTWLQNLSHVMSHHDMEDKLRQITSTLGIEDAETTELN